MATVWKKAQKDEIQKWRARRMSPVSVRRQYFK